MKLNVSKIKNLIAQRKWNVSEFAERIGIHRNTVYTMYRTGNSSPDTIKKMAEVLKVEELSLFDGYQNDDYSVQNMYMDLDTPINRVRKFMNARGMTAYKFSRLTDLPTRTVNRRFHDGNLDIDFLKGLIKVFPEIDIHWVITGETRMHGSMVAEASSDYGSEIAQMKEKLQLAYDRAFELERILKEKGIVVK